ncbi:MAG: histidine triad nucleotide-binding protein [Rickettsiales bacterium]|jgi:diadenosine tetraphosphate (Ap4A) HIT family hydrolase|nr:histidine triad nucleotide-binding protein [Rickettsiales bacterium]
MKLERLYIIRQTLKHRKSIDIIFPISITIPYTVVDICKMQAKYDKNNVFFKIINKQLPSDICYEDDKVLCFHDIDPKAPTHLLLVPKREFVSFNDFMEHSNSEDVAYFFKTAQKIAKQFGLESYRIVSNCGEGAGQVVFHFHLHIMGY